MRKASGLESVWRWRRSLERAAELALKKAIGDLNRAHAELDGIVAERRALRVECAGRLREGALAEVFRLHSEEVLDAIQRDTLERLKRCELRRMQAEVRYAECRRDRKVMEKMLDRRRAEERIEASRREQVRIDEATLQRAGTQPAESNIGRSE